MKMIEVNTAFLAPYVQKRMVVSPSSLAGLVYDGTILFLYVEEGIAYMGVQRRAVIEGTLNDALHSEAPWAPWDFDDKIYQLSTNAIIDDDGHLTFVPTFCGTFARLWR